MGDIIQYVSLPLRKLLLFALSVSSAFAQGQAVNQVQGPPPTAWVGQDFYNGSNQIIYICYSPAYAALTTYSVASSTLTSIAVATNVGTVTLSATAQFWVGSRLVVSGSTTSALNGTYKVTAVSGSTVTITTSGVADATYNTAALVITTNAPLLNAPVWSIQAFTYAAGYLSGSYWGGNPTGITVPQGLACSARASY